MKLPKTFISIMMPVLMFGQAATSPPKPAPSAPAAAKKSTPAPRKADSDVDKVIKLVQSGVSEEDIIQTLRDQNKPITVTLDDLAKLSSAKVSKAIIAVMRNPAAAPAAAAAPVAASAPVTPAPAPDMPRTTATEIVPVSTKPPVTDKKRVIVDEFDYAAVLTQIQAIFGTQQNLGKGIRAMLAKRVAESNQMVVVERQKIDMIQKEQDRNAGNRVKQGTGARIGRIRGADAILMGDVVIFGRDDKKKKMSFAGVLNPVQDRIVGALSNWNKEEKAVVAITYRLVDAETSEVIAAGEARGESSRKSKGWGGLAAVGGAAAGGGMSVESSNFAETIIGEATMDCVNKLAEIMNKQVPGLKGKVVEVEANVVDVNGSSVMIAAGSNDGVNAGEVFEVLRVIREVKDPVTKEVLDRVTEPVGSLTISNVRDRTATGTYGGRPVQAGTGFIARKKMQ